MFFNKLLDSLPLMNVNQSPIEVFRMRDLGILADLIVHSLGNTPWTDLSKIDSDGRTIHFIIIHIIHQKIDDETKIRKKKTILKSMKKCSLWLILPICWDTRYTPVRKAWGLNVWALSEPSEPPQLVSTFTPQWLTRFWDLKNASRVEASSLEALLRAQKHLTRWDLSVRGTSEVGSDVEGDLRLSKLTVFRFFSFSSIVKSTPVILLINWHEKCRFRKNTFDFSHNYIGSIPNESGI